MLGIGAALTDAAAETFYKLPKDYFLWIKGKAAKTTSPVHSIATLVVE